MIPAIAGTDSGQTHRWVTSYHFLKVSNDHLRK
jgi:hypothetical protein